MATKLHLRPYQQEAIDAVFVAWDEGVFRPAVVMATGLGKTYVFSHLADRYIHQTGKRVLILVHRDELADQALKSIRDIAPYLRTGKVKASDNEVGSDVVVASVQTLSRGRRLEQLQTGSSRRIGLVITDEVHHGLAPTYRRIYDAFGCGTPTGARSLGVTATLARGDGKGLGSVVDDVVYQKSIAWGIRHKYLSPVKGVAVRVPTLDLSGVKKSGGDFQTGDLGRAVESSGVLDILPKAYLEHASDRPGVVFSPTVATAHEVQDSFTDAGISTAVISGETTREERVKIFEDYRTGRVQVLSNCMVLTEGFDAPHTSCIVVARPTQSQPLYVQMVGRGTRTFPGKEDCLVLDVVGAGATNKLQTLVDLEEGLFSDPKPCEVCDHVPCVCPCAVCGMPKPCGCPTERPELEVDRGQTGELDLFAGSMRLWLQTPKGVMFLGTDMGEVLLWPSQTAGTWDVALAPRTGRWERLHTSLPLGTAMAWAEAEAEDRASFGTGKRASWRKGKPSEAQLSAAHKWGVTVPDGASKGTVSELISVAVAGARIDRYVKS